MKKRILSILLLCCMVLTMLPTTAFAAGELPDVKLSVPTTFDKTVDLTKQNKELKIKDSKTYLIKGSADPNWYFQYRIKIDGKNNTPHIFLDGVREREAYYIHTCEGDDDMPAHAKSTLVGTALTLPVSRGRINLGTWQGIYLCEFRNRAAGRRIVATVVG